MKFKLGDRVTLKYEVKKDKKWRIWEGTIVTFKTLAKSRIGVRWDNPAQNFPFKHSDENPKDLEKISKRRERLSYD